LNKKTIYIIVAVLVVVIIIAGAAAYLLSNNGNGGTTNPTPTPTPTVSVADATTLKFSANVTSQGQTTEYKWQGRDIKSSNLTLRVDFATYAYILDAGQEKSWMSADSGATWTASTFAADWGTVAAPGFGNQWAEYVNHLTTNWNGSDNQYSYANTAGEAIVLFNINVNPTIPASTFTTS
jgi:hypothetical protein